MNSVVYIYEIREENVANGIQSESSQEYYSNVPLKVGGLYMHLRDLPGAYRVERLTRFCDAMEVKQ